MRAAAMFAKPRTVAIAAGIVAVLAAPISERAASQQSAAAEILGRTFVWCKLPDQIRTQGRGRIMSMPGPVDRLEYRVCQDRVGQVIENACSLRVVLKDEAEQGDAERMRWLAVAYEQQDPPACVSDPRNAAVWYERAAAKGDRQSALALSRLLSQGALAGRQGDPAEVKRLVDTALGIDVSTILTAENRQLVESLDASRVRIAQLEQQLHELERSSASAEVRLRAEVVRTEQAAAQAAYERTLDKVDPRLLVQASGTLGAPKQIEIVMLDPPLLTQRSGQPAVIPISGTVESRPEYEVVGRVLVPTGMHSEISVKVNGRPAERVEAEGFFRSAVPMAGPSRNVTVEANGPQLRPAMQQFRLQFADANRILAAPPSRLSIGGRSYALVIGITDYQESHGDKRQAHWPDLKNARGDAEQVGKTLESLYGFKVEYLLDKDATHYAILASLIRMRDVLEVNDQFLVYYAGHGAIDRVSTRGFWIPYDAFREVEPTVGPHWIQSEQITNALEGIRARQILLISDSCYSAALNPTIFRPIPANTEKSRARALAEIAALSSRLIMTSGSFAPVPDRGLGGSHSAHSLFAGALLESLTANTGVVTGRDLFVHVESIVLQRSRALAINVSPQYGGLDSVGHAGGDFVLARLNRSDRKLTWGNRRYEQLSAYVPRLGSLREIGGGDL